MNFETFLVGQPRYPEESSTDVYYFNLAVRLVKIAEEEGLMKTFHSAVIERAALCVIGYYQDAIADAGLWHGFTDECRRLYGAPVPFYEISEDYIDYELNPEDVGFMVWYAIAMYSDNRSLYPYDPRIVRLASLWYDVLESTYEEAPVPEGYHLAHELEVHAEEDREMILRLGSWLFLHSWLLTPAFALTNAEIISGMSSRGESREAIAEALQEAVKTNPTGPLALYLSEWVSLTINHKLPSRRERKEQREAHPSFKAMMEETGGLPVKFIEGYDALNRYLIDVLGWKAGEEHLSQLKSHRDFILMSNPEKGLLVATDIARCVAAPQNHIYDKRYASLHAIELLTERGACPHDLLAYIYEMGWLPDAKFPGSEDYDLVSRWHDFIERCYLQLYYRGD